MRLIIQNIAKFSTRAYLLVDSDCSLKPWPISGNGFRGYKRRYFSGTYYSKSK